MRKRKQNAGSNVDPEKRKKIEGITELCTNLMNRGILTVYDMNYHDVSSRANK